MHTLDQSTGRDLHVIDLTVSYGDGDRSVKPVDGFTMFAPSGRVTALVGRSGTGKTTILSCVAATLRAASGQVWLGGIDVGSLTGDALSKYRRDRVGVVHQQYNLIPSLTVRENVMLPMTLAGRSRREAQSRADELLSDLQVGSVARRKPRELSGGQQQRVAVARALANDPSLVVADEPTAHLDGCSVDDVAYLLRSVAEQGRTVILSTHDDRLLGAVDQVIALQPATR
jgi:putative ABC transport system ATP-binding protein